MKIFIAGAFFGSLFNFLIMCLAFCAGEGSEHRAYEEENTKLKKQLEELTEKHLNECRQISEYEAENREMREQINRCIETIRKFEAEY